MAYETQIKKKQLCVLNINNVPPTINTYILQYLYLPSISNENITLFTVGKSCWTATTTTTIFFYSDDNDRLKCARHKTHGHDATAHK